MFLIMMHLYGMSMSSLRHTFSLHVISTQQPHHTKKCPKQHHNKPKITLLLYRFSMYCSFTTVSKHKIKIIFIKSFPKYSLHIIHLLLLPPHKPIPAPITLHETKTITNNTCYMFTFLNPGNRYHSNWGCLHHEQDHQPARHPNHLPHHLPRPHQM
jgi:hypothetical protein